MTKKKLQDLKQLSEDKLDQVNGGDDWGDKKGKYLPDGHGPHIPMYADQWVGQKVYVVLDSDPKEYVWGTLVRSYEEDRGCNVTKRLNEVLVEGFGPAGFSLSSSGAKRGCCTSFGSSYTMFLYGDEGQGGGAADSW